MKKNNLIDFDSYLSELSIAESEQVYGGSPFYQVGTWVGEGLEALVNAITTPSNGEYPDHPSWV